MGEPLPAEPKLSWPGLALASAISSLMDFAGSEGMQHYQTGKRRDFGDCGQIFHHVVTELGVKAGAYRVRHAAHQQRISIGCSLRNLLGTDVAARADAVFNDDRLPHPLRDFLADDARQHVGRAAGRKWGDQADRFVWIILRESCASQQ